MVDGITTGQTFHLHDEDTGPTAQLDLLDEVLHNGAGGYGFTGDDFPVDLGYVQMVAAGNLKEELFVAGQSFPVTVRLGLQVHTGFAQVHTVFVGTG